LDWTKFVDMIYGCANQADEDNRNVGRMSALLASLPIEVPATTIKPFMWFICGATNPVTTIADAQFIQAQISNSRLVQIDTLHISNVEQATAFHQTLLPFPA
jgi:pimeloyl-ACP methyl ester carboxylesterase